jgi:methionine biosynthesis protein MetW
MRDSALKRSLVRAYFSAIEVRKAITGTVATPVASLGHGDYDAYWESRALQGIEPRFSIIAAGVERGATVLDIGCGDGALLAHLRDTHATSGVGLDLSAVAVRKATERGLTAHVADLLAPSLPPIAPRFDHVVVSEVVEHVADAEAAVQRAWGLTSGTLWLTFPNIAYFPHRLRLLSGRFPVQWVYFPGEHLRYWSVPDMRAWLGRLGLPAPQFLPSNGVTSLGLHRAWPNLFANQIVVRLDRPRG